MKYFRRFNNENEFNEFTSKGFAPQFYIFTLKDGSKNIIYKHKMNCDFRVEHSFTDEELTTLTQKDFIAELPYSTKSFKINNKECLEITKEKNFTVTPVLEYKNENIYISDYPLKHSDYDRGYCDFNPNNAIIDIYTEKEPTSVALSIKDGNENILNIIDIQNISNWETIGIMENGTEVLGMHLIYHSAILIKMGSKHFQIIIMLSDWAHNSNFKSTVLFGTEELFDKLQSNDDTEITEAITELNSYNTTFNVSYPTGIKINMDGIIKSNNSVVEISFNNDAIGHYALPSSAISAIVNEDFTNDSVWLRCNNEIKCLEINNYTGLVGASSSELKSIVLGENFYYLEDYIFNGCTGLEFITCKAITPPAMSPEDEVTKNHVFDGVDKNIPIYVPKGTISSYQNAPGWKEFKNIQEIY